MKIKVFETKLEMANAAAAEAANAIRAAIATHGEARIVAATGASQFEFLEALVDNDGIDWGRVELFHLDEYIGLSAEHPASFRKYLLERLIRPAGITRYHLLDGEADAGEVCRAVGEKLRQSPIDIAFVGIGENGHLAFNDPPADFETAEPYLVVELDEACRRQQLGEGWFSSLEDIPTHAISMSIRQILAAKQIVCVVPDARKAQAVRDCLTRDEPDPKFPASALLHHPNTTVYLDKPAAMHLSF